MSGVDYYDCENVGLKSEVSQYMESSYLLYKEFW
jgi:hypothetical protein